MKRNVLNRRGFLKTTAALFPAIIPASALGRDGHVAPSDRIVMGSIGIGAMGGGNLHAFLEFDQVQHVAVCDVDSERCGLGRDAVNEHYGTTGCAMHHDFRELIGRGDLDAVVIAVPDHWHAIPAIMAARAGLDIYGEKPLARSIREGRAICNAVKRYSRVWQMGSHQRSQAHFRHACELVRNGRIGKVHRVEVGLPTGSSIGPQPVMPVPERLDYEFWLGPAPWAPYTEKRCHWNWRWILDYSGGQLTDWSGHHIDIAHWGLGLTETGPVEIEGHGVYPQDGLWNTPTEYRFTCQYANGLEMEVANNKQLTQGTKWFGEDGWIHVNRAGLTAENPKVLDEVIGPDEIQLYRSPDHRLDFLECIRTRSQPVAPVEQGHRSISVGLLGEIAMLTGRKIKWNPDTEEIINDPGAAALLGRSYREPWHL